MIKEVIDSNTNKVMCILDYDENPPCKGRNISELCGGCSECLSMQYIYYGYIVKDISKIHLIQYKIKKLFYKLKYKFL